MVNGRNLYSIDASHSLTHTHTHTHTHTRTPTPIGCHARHQPARQEQLGVRHFAQGLFDTPRVGSSQQPSDCQTTALASWVVSLCCMVFACNRNSPPPLYSIYRFSYKTEVLIKPRVKYTSYTYFFQVPKKDIYSIFFLTNVSNS